MYYPNINSKRVTFLITGYLGIPATDHSILKNEEQRFDATLRALRELRENCGNARILLAFTGDVEALKIIVRECDFSETDAAIFPQSLESIPLGKGLLEHQLICRALDRWKLYDDDKLIIKLTAKYSIENLDDVINFATRSNAPIFGWMHFRKSMIDSRCFFFRAASYNNFRNILDRVDERENFFFEHAIFNILSKLNISPGLLDSRPIVSGLSGSSGVFVRMSAWKRFIIRFVSSVKFRI